MKLPVRIIVLLIVTVATYYFVFWLPFSLILPPGRFHWIRFSGSLICAVCAGSYFWRSTSPKDKLAPAIETSAASSILNNSEARPAPGGLAKCIFIGALVTGAIGFVAGFFGPIIFEPGANQGPLLGIFITGPFGAVAGAIGGAIYWAIEARSK